MANQDYVVVTTIAPTLSCTAQGTNLVAGWFGLPGVTYQIYSSTNLVDWVPYGEPFAGSNAVVQIPLPIGGGPQEFFRVQAAN